MINLKDWMELVDYRITEGGDYGWSCYGMNSYTLDSWNGDCDGHSFSIIFDTKTQEVYEVQAHDYQNNRAYRLINADYVTAFQNEVKSRGTRSDEAWEGVNYVSLETDDDWLEKASAISLGLDYDTRVTVPVDFSDEELLKYMTMAHERDMTFNQFIEEALQYALDEFNRDPEGLTARARHWKESNGID